MFTEMDDAVIEQYALALAWEDGRNFRAAWQAEDERNPSSVQALISGWGGLVAAAPTQARAPRGTPIGGQWIDTPGALLQGLAPSGGDEAVGYDSPVLDAVAKNRNKPGRLEGTGTVDDPIYVGQDMDRAMDLLGEGKYVRIDSNDDDLKVLTDKLATEAKGTSMDICKVSIDQNLFCSGSKGRPRVTMPQFSSEHPLPGSIADGKPKDKGGAVNMSDDFKADLASRGIGFTTASRPAANYLPAQSEMLASKSAGIAKALQSGKKMPGTVFVSRDGYVIDGHHRWAAVNINTGQGFGDGMMDVEIVDMDITDVLHYANQWTEDVGLPHADIMGNPVASDAAKAADNRLRARLAAMRAQTFAPEQARAPKGSSGGIGGEWIPTPGAVLDTVRAQGGASIHPVTGLEPTTGYQVGLKGYTKIIPQDEFFGPAGEDALFTWIEENREPLSQPGAHVGLWHDTKTGNVVFDVSMNVEDRDEAIRMGEENDQVSIWDNVVGDEIDTGGTGEGLRSSADRQVGTYRMDDHDRPQHPRPAPARGTPRGLLPVARGAKAGVHPRPDQRRGAGLTAALTNADQVRAPKGTPQGGEWIDTPGGMARQIAGVNRAVRGLGKPGEPRALDTMDDDYATLVGQVNPGYLENPDDARYNQNCQRVVQAMEMRARGFDAKAAAWDGTRDDSIAIEDCWVDPATGSTRLFNAELPPNQAIKVIQQYPPGSRFILSGWSEDEQYGHVWNGEIQADGTLLEVDGQGGSNMGESIYDMYDQVQWLRVDDLTPTESMFDPPPLVITPDTDPMAQVASAGPPDPVAVGQAAGYDVVALRDLGAVWHLLVADPPRKWSDSLLVMDKGTGEVGYVSRFSLSAVA